LTARGDLDPLDGLAVAPQQRGHRAAAAAGEAAKQQAERRHPFEVSVGAREWVVDGDLVAAVADGELHGALLHGVDAEFGRHGHSLLVVPGCVILSAGTPGCRPRLLALRTGVAQAGEHAPSDPGEEECPVIDVVIWSDIV
jgi:hypothetical protein